MHICIYAGTNLTHFLFLAKKRFPRARSVFGPTATLSNSAVVVGMWHLALLSAQHRDVLDGGLCLLIQTRIIQLFSAIVFRRREWDRRSKDVAWHLIKSSGGAWLRLSRLYNMNHVMQKRYIRQWLQRIHWLKWFRLHKKTDRPIRGEVLIGTNWDSSHDLKSG